MTYHIESIRKHYPNQGGYTYHDGTRWLEFTIRDILMTSHSNFSSFIDYITDWLDSSSEFTLQIVRDSSLNKVEWDGDNTSFTVTIKTPGLKGMEQIAKEPKELYLIREITFEEI